MSQAQGRNATEQLRPGGLTAAVLSAGCRGCRWEQEARQRSHTEWAETGWQQTVEGLRLQTFLGFRRQDVLMDRGGV